MSRLLYGVGVNDSGYPATRLLPDGKRRLCPFYRVWTSMLDRCYSQSYQTRFPTYKGCSVAEEWLSLSAFRAWMEKQNWQGMQLDKDLLHRGNNVYGPKSCVFISENLNNFMLGSEASKRDLPVGVRLSLNKKRFRADCNNPFTGKLQALGYFDTPEEAHAAWRKRKHELACIYADQQTDPRIAKALRERFAQ